ncbi:MAG TPA: hypothetical protein VJB57_15355 [Dehalococcoidia bacterium]|nr:hypothetical protein [Dehalococcoidia bacterium]
MKRSLLTLVVAGIAALSLGFALKSAPSAEAAPQGAAWNLNPYSVTCNQASFSWQASGWGTQQWLDLSHWNGFYWQWEHAGAFGTWASSHTWHGLKSNTTYYVRVNTGTWWGQWLASDWVSFHTPSCQIPPQPCTYGSGPGSQLIICPPKPVCPPVSTQVVPQVIAQTGCIWTDRANYGVGQQVVYCYRVSQPMYINIVVSKPDGSQVGVVQGYDDGRGDCIYNLYTGLPVGTRTVYMYGPGGQLLDTTQFTVN